MAILDVKNINAYIGTAHILRNVSLTVEEGGVTLILGRNGAGKTTIMRSVLGLTDVRSGEILFKGKDLRELPTHLRIKAGIGYSPQDRRIFPDLTVEENIKMASWLRGVKDVEDVMKIVYSIFPELERMKGRKGLFLSGGEQKMLAIARALASKPSLLLLDEPFEGLAPVLCKRLLEKVLEIRRMGVAMLIAESNISLIPEFTEKLYVLERGEIVYIGGPKELYENENVMKIIRGY
ncbi:MAG: ABC transporter ATP-binding protein [Candidatus Bathyarchaeia archaeon]